jgi:hypothetical protein
LKILEKPELSWGSDVKKANNSPIKQVFPDFPDARLRPKGR